jgi:hypothetical protein
MSKELAQSNKKLVIGINKTWESALSDSKSAMNKSVLTGEMLAELKLKTEHGKWAARFKSGSNPTSNVGFDFNFSVDHAARLIRIYENKDLIRITSNGEVLTINEMTQIIANITPEQIAQVEQIKKDQADKEALAEATAALAETARILKAAQEDEVIEGVFEEVKAPVVEPEIIERPVEDPFDVLQETIEMLETDNTALQAEVESMVKVFESNDQLTTALAEVKKFQELARVLKESLNGSMNSENAAKRQAKMWKAKYEKLAKEVGRE